MSRPIELLSVIALLMWSTIASAHHGRAGYDFTTVVELEGELVEVRWTNPHVGFAIIVTNAEGVDRRWSIERTGVSADEQD